MSETSALRPGQKVTLSGEVLALACRTGLDVAFDCGDDDRWIAYNVPASALTPVVEPEPVWSPGDVVRIDGVNHMLRTDGIRPGWSSPDVRTNVISGQNFSELWREGRVVVVYRKEADK